MPERLKRPNFTDPIDLYTTLDSLRGVAWFELLCKAYAFIEQGFIVQLHYQMLDKPQQRDMDATVAAVRANPHL